MSFEGEDNSKKKPVPILGGGGKPGPIPPKKKEGYMAKAPIRRIMKKEGAKG